MKYKKSLGSLVFDRCNEIACLVFSLLCLYPFVYVFSVSISDFQAIGLGQVYLLPVNPSFKIYGDVLAATSVGRAYLNSILYTGLFTLLNLWLNTMGGYVLAEQKFLFKRGVTLYLTVTMFLGGGMIPTFLWISALKLYNTLWAVVLPGAVSAWNVFMFRTYIRENIHQSLKDSVYMDGGSDFTIYTRIVIPLIKPMLATFALFAIVSMWNNYFTPLVYLNDAAKMPLTIMLRKALIRTAGDAGELSAVEMSDAESSIVLEGWQKAKQMALVIITIAPILLTYPFLQKYFVKGIMVGSIKE